jgi:hypothetical protein
MTFITMLHRPVRIKICRDFWERARVVRNRGRDIMGIEPSGERRLKCSWTSGSAPLLYKGRQ